MNLMFFVDLFSRVQPRQHYWCNQDNDIPVTFVRVAGEFAGVKFAEVQYDGKTSYVPLNEIEYR